MRESILKIALCVLLEMERCVDRASEQLAALEKEENREPLIAEL